MTQFRDVSEAELKSFVQNYATKLTPSAEAMGEPPMMTYNDFSRGDWPKSVVARVVLWKDSYPNKDGSKRMNQYQIRVD